MPWPTTNLTANEFTYIIRPTTSHMEAKRPMNIQVAYPIAFLNESQSHCTVGLIDVLSQGILQIATISDIANWINW